MTDVEIIQPSMELTFQEGSKVKVSFGLGPQGPKGSKGDTNSDTLADAVQSLDETRLVGSAVVEVAGIPVYVADADLSAHAAYGLTKSGWCVFARINAPDGVTVGTGAAVTGADGAIIAEGAAYVDVAIRFEVAAMSRVIAVAWDGETETEYVFRATDLAIRNLDYRTTNYTYDLSQYATWEYALTTDEKFVAGSRYFTRDGDVYTEALEGTDWTADDDIPADTYYKHSKLIVSGMVKNVPYKLDEVVDCEMDVHVPEIDTTGYGVWYEFHLIHDGSHSIVIVPAVDDVKAATAGASAAITKGLNVVDFHYTDVAGRKTWSLANVHTNIPD